MHGKPRRATAAVTKAALQQDAHNATGIGKPHIARRALLHIVLGDSAAVITYLQVDGVEVTPQQAVLPTISNMS